MNVLPKQGMALLLSVFLWMFSGLTSTHAIQHLPAYDLNGDAKADLLWRNSSSGIVSAWLMNGETIASNGLLPTIPSEWQMVGMGDVNADNRADIIWRNSASGGVAVWMMDGLTIKSTGFPGSASMEWAIHAVGDLNGDARTDLVWRNTNTGEVSMWLMNGSKIVSSGIPAGVPLDWQIAGVADMNADGKGDVIWRHGTTGTIAVWLMNGLNIISTGFPGSTPPDWEIAGTGDVDGDGKSDFVWRNILNGAVSVWLMNGISVASSGFLDGVPTNWVIAQMGDTDADGKADIIWRNSTTGVVSVWKMKGLVLTSVGYPGAIDTGTSSGVSRGADSVVPKLLTPSTGSTLPGSTITFTWTANGAALTAWSLRVGLSAGESDVYNSGNLPSETLAHTVSGLPTNGVPVWVRLQWRYTDGSWSSTDIQYNEKTGTGGTSTSSPSPTPSTPTAPNTSNPSPTPSGSAFFVSTSGNDVNPGTQSSPFRTIKRGLGVLQPGNTLFIRGGTYQEFLHSWNGTRFPSGNSWSSPITIAAFNGETVNLVGSIDLAQSSPAIQYLIFDGIRINANGEETGISLTGNTHHIRFQNGEVKNAGRWGIATNFHNTTSFADTFYEFINLDVHHNGRTKNVDHGFYIKTSRNLIDGCHIHDNVAWGIHNFAGDNSEPKANNNTYRNNLIHHNGINYSQGGGITMGSGDNNIAYNNVVWKNYTGINVHSYRNPVNSGVFHNTIYGNTGYGILIEPGSQGADVINNISYGNYVNMDNRGSGTSISNNLTSNPSFKNASAGDFHLQSGSAAIDTGTTLSAVPTDREGRRRPQGNRSDIGAYEW